MDVVTLVYTSTASEVILQETNYWSEAATCCFYVILFQGEKVGARIHKTPATLIGSEIFQCCHICICSSDSNVPTGGEEQWENSMH